MIIDDDGYTIDRHHGMGISIKISISNTLKDKIYSREMCVSKGKQSSAYANTQKI